MALAAILTVSRIMGLNLLNWYHNQIQDGTIYTIEQWLVELMLLGSILGIVFWGAGIVLVIQRISSRTGQPEISQLQGGWKPPPQNITS
jgi:hypothetical protein